MTKLRQHVIPVGGAEPQHIAAPSCWCFPLAQIIPDVRDPYTPDMMAHNARDCREARERITGEAVPGAGWVRVLEEVPEPQDSCRADAGNSPA